MGLHAFPNSAKARKLWEFLGNNLENFVLPFHLLPLDIIHFKDESHFSVLPLPLPLPLRLRLLPIYPSVPTPWVASWQLCSYVLQLWKRADSDLNSITIHQKSSMTRGILKHGYINLSTSRSIVSFFHFCYVSSVWQPACATTLSHVLNLDCSTYFNH